MPKSNGGSIAPNEKDLQFLYEFARTLGGLFGKDEVLQYLVKNSRHFFASKAASIIWLDPDGTQVFRFVEGYRSEKILGLRIPKDEGISGWVVEHRETVWVQDVLADTRFFVGVDHSTGFKTNSILAAPINGTDAVIAVLEVVNPSISIDNEIAKYILTSLTSMTADALIRCDILTQAFTFKQLLETASEPNLLFTPLGYLCYVNNAARSAFNIQDDISENIHFDSLHISDIPFHMRVDEIQNRDNIVWELSIKDIIQSTYKMRMSRVEVNDSEKLYILAYDITDINSMQNSRMQLFNMLVHDLRVPLGSIHHSLELVMTAWNEKDFNIPVNQVLEIALRSESRMERLINDILDTTLLNSQSKTLEVTSINIGELVKDTISIIESSARRRNHVLVTKIESTVESFRGDLDLLQRVFINILGNAVKYTSDGGEIFIAVYDNEENVYFEVRDDGPGILSSDEEHIFDLFYRGNNHRVKGAGIGLAFSKLAIEAHSGKIWLDQTVDKGAKFVFYIPKQLPKSAIIFEE